MKKTIIHTGLEDFVLIDRILQIRSRDVSGIRTFTNDPAYLGLESLAQLGAYHVRYLTRFKTHAFLLKINDWSVWGPNKLNGLFELSGKLISRSSSAFSYGLEAKKGGHCRMKGEVLFATVDYDERFKKDRLEPHFRARFSWLWNDSRAD